MSPNIKLLMPIEISNRELIWRTLFCKKAAAHGIKCYLGSKREINYLMDKVGPFIYLDNGFNKEVSGSIFQRVKDNRGIIMSLDEEGAIDFEDQSTLSVRYDEELFNQASLVLFWGQDQLSKIAKKKYSQSKVIVTGHPRFEYLKTEYQYLYEEDRKEIENKYGRFILFNTNMGFGNNYRGKEFILKNYGGRFKNIRSIINNDEIKLKAYLELAKKLADLQKQKIIIRPHPEEDIKFYKDAFKNYRNISVIYEKSVIPWILASDVLIHPDCTTGVEALMLGKKPISFLPKGLDERLLTVLPLKASCVFNSKKELIQYINSKKFKDDNIHYPEYEWLQSSFNFSVAITDIILSEILKISAMGNNHNHQKSLTAWARYKIYLRHNYHKVRSPYDELLRSKMDGFISNNVDFIVDTINKNNPKFNTIIVKKINSHLYQFSQ